jgi:precorrin-6B methylase 2
MDQQDRFVGPAVHAAAVGSKDRRIDQILTSNCNRAGVPQLRIRHESAGQERKCLKQIRSIE